MRVIVETKSNYRNLNGKELDVIEIIGTRCTCVIDDEFWPNSRAIKVDFHINEIKKFTVGCECSRLLGQSFGQPDYIDPSRLITCKNYTEPDTTDRKSA